MNYFLCAGTLGAIWLNRTNHGTHWIGLYCTRCNVLWNYGAVLCCAVLLCCNYYSVITVPYSIATVML